MASYANEEFHIYHRSELIEDVARSMEIKRMFHQLQCDALTGFSSKKSKAVQTDPEVERIPPSWILATENLICKIHTHLANIINKLYHAPSVYSSSIDIEADRKYFKYADTDWQSKLLNQQKIYLAELHQENFFKRELSSLMDLMSNLKDRFPQIQEDLLNSDIKCNFNNTKITSDVDVSCVHHAQITTPRNFSKAGPSNYAERISKLNLGSDSGCSLSSVDGKKLNIVRIMKQEPKLSARVRPLFSSSEVETTELMETKFAVAKHETEKTASAKTLLGIKSVNSSSMQSSRTCSKSRIPLAIKNTGSDVYRTLKKDEAATMSKNVGQAKANKENSNQIIPHKRYETNFIKRNILATKSSIIDRKSKQFL